MQKDFEGRGFPIVARELPQHDNDFDALIGMDVLRSCLLIVDREQFIFLTNTQQIERLFGYTKR